MQNCQLPGVEIARELLNAHRGTPFVSKILEAVKITSEDKNMTVLNHGLVIRNCTYIYNE